MSTNKDDTNDHKEKWLLRGLINSSKSSCHINCALHLLYCALPSHSRTMFCSFPITISGYLFNLETTIPQNDKSYSQTKSTLLVDDRDNLHTMINDSESTLLSSLEFIIELSRVFRGIAGYINKPNDASKYSCIDPSSTTLFELLSKRINCYDFGDAAVSLQVVIQMLYDSLCCITTTTLDDCEYLIKNTIQSLSEFYLNVICHHFDNGESNERKMQVSELGDKALAIIWENVKNISLDLLQSIRNSLWNGTTLHQVYAQKSILRSEPLSSEVFETLKIENIHISTNTQQVNRKLDPKKEKLIQLTRWKPVTKRNMAMPLHLQIIGFKCLSESLNNMFNNPKLIENYKWDDEGLDKHDKMKNTIVSVVNSDDRQTKVLLRNVTHAIDISEIDKHSNDKEIIINDDANSSSCSSSDSSSNSSDSDSDSDVSSSSTSSSMSSTTTMSNIPVPLPCWKTQEISCMYQIPSVLILHLKRFEYNQGVMKRITSNIKITYRIDLSSFTASDHGQNLFENEMMKDDETKNAVCNNIMTSNGSNKLEQYQHSSQKKICSKCFLFELNGAVVYTCQGKNDQDDGHYTTYLCNEDFTNDKINTQTKNNKLWSKIDDHHVTSFLVPSDLPLENLDGQNHVINNVGICSTDMEESSFRKVPPSSNGYKIIPQHKLLNLFGGKDVSKIKDNRKAKNQQSFATLLLYKALCNCQQK